MISPQFKNLYSKLNIEQKEAVDEIEGPVMVIAGPGTGKTQILTIRIANILLKTQINPENILALTFSESASFEMRMRLSKIIGSPSFRVMISTFHSFANDIIKNYPDEFPLLLSSEPITEIEQIELVERLINSLELKLLRPFGEALYYLKDILSSINDLKKEGKTPEQLKTIIQKQKEDFVTLKDLYHEKGKYKGEMKGFYLDLKKDIEKTEEFLSVFDNYETKLREEKKYDFNDMLLEVIRALESNKSLLLRIQEKYQYILIDEHQDTNAAQNKLIELIASFYKIPNLFVVGDEKQAIYRFQGASLENFLYFKTLYPSAKLINLQKSYRSHQLILDASSSLIGKNISANILPKKDLIAGKRKVEKIKVARFENYDLEYEYIASEIAKKIKIGVNPSSIAVLARRNSDLFPLTKILNRLGIKFIVEENQDILKDLHIEKLLMIFKSIARPFEAAPLIKVLQIDFLGIDPFDIYKILNYSSKQKIEINELLGKKGNPEALTNFYSKYRNWVKLNHNIPFDDLFVKVINESGFREYFLKLERAYQTLNKLTGLFDEIKLKIVKNPKFNLEDFLYLCQTAEKHKVPLHRRMVNVNEEGIRMLTAHKSKGLEFNRVYIINCFDGRWGNSKKRGAKIKIPWEYMGQNIKADVSFDRIEDERRLFYVAMTRARQGVTLSYSKYSSDNKEQLPSQFLQEINPKFLENINTSSFEKTFDRLEIFNFSKKVKIDLKDKKYLQRLFLEKGLSATGLDNFLKCPWQYFFRNLVMLPEMKDKNLIYGSGIHFALDSYIKSRRLKALREQFLINKFKEYLSRQSLSDQETKELLSKGEKALKLFYKQVIPGWSGEIISELIIKGVKLAEGIILNGRIDMIEVLSKDRVVRVHDFKSGKPKSRSQNFLRQLTFYKILLDRYKEGFLKMKEGVIDFVEPDDKGRLKSEVFIMEDIKVAELESEIKFVSDQIMNLKFWDQKCADLTCEYCHLKEMVFPSNIRYI